MVKKIYLLFISVIIMTVPISAGDWLASYNYDDNESETICGAAEAHPDDPNGGFLLVGFGYDSYNDLWIRIDRYGNKLWVKKPGQLLAGSKAAHYTDDGGFLIGGNLGITKIDANGDIVSGWEEPVDILTHVYHIEKYDENRYLLFGLNFSFCCTFDEITQETDKYLNFNYPIVGGCPDVALTKGNKFVFCGKKYLLRTDTELNPDITFGTDGYLDYTIYDCEYGQSIAACDDGSGYVIACRKKSTEEINLIKINTNGDLVTSFNYSPSQPLNFVDESAISIKKYFGVKELSTRDFILGGSFQNGDNSDFFIQIVSATGNEEYIKKFENSGYDADY